MNLDVLKEVSGCHYQRLLHYQMYYCFSASITPTIITSSITANTNVKNVDLPPTPVLPAAIEVA